MRTNILRLQTSKTEALAHIRINDTDEHVALILLHLQVKLRQNSPIRTLNFTGYTLGPSVYRTQFQDIHYNHNSDIKADYALFYYNNYYNVHEQLFLYLAINSKHFNAVV